MSDQVGNQNVGFLMTRLTLCYGLYLCILIHLWITNINHGVQRRMISVVNFSYFEIIISCLVVAICDLVQGVEAMYGLP